MFCFSFSDFYYSGEALLTGKVLVVGWWGGKAGITRVLTYVHLNRGTSLLSLYPSHLSLEKGFGWAFRIAFHI